LTAILSIVDSWQNLTAIPSVVDSWQDLTAILSIVDSWQNLTAILRIVVFSGAYLNKLRISVVLSTSELLDLRGRPGWVLLYL